MTNRLVSNMYIIDSEQIAQPLTYGVSAALCTTANVGKMKVSAVIFIAMTSNARCQIALGDTTNVILDYGFFNAQSNAMTQRVQVDHFGYGVPWSSVFVPVITASTMCLVLE